jgi:hypothetical protein
MEEYGATVKEWSFPQDKGKQSTFLNKRKMTHTKSRHVIACGMVSA